MSAVKRIKICLACLRHKVYDAPESQTCSYCDPAVELTSIEEGLGRGKIFARRFLIDAHLGGGGFGSVWKARDLKTKCRNVAIKVLRLGTDGMSTAVEREIAALATLSSPRVVTIYEGIDSGHGDPFFVMEFLQGSSLRSYLSSVRGENGALGAGLQLPSAIRMWKEIIRAVADLHSQSPPIIHRDLKPENIVLTKDPPGQWLEGRQHLQITGEIRLKLIDFGTAKDLGSKKPNDQTVKAHTPLYAAPEQIPEERRKGRQREYLFKDVGEQADVFALTLIFLELLPDFDPQVLGYRWLNSEALPSAITKLTQGMSGELQALVRSGLSTEAAERPPNAMAVLDRLQQTPEYAVLSSPKLPTLSTETKPPPRLRSLGGLWLVLSAATTMLVAGLLFALFSNRPIKDEVLRQEARDLLHRSLWAPGTERILRLRIIEWAGRSRDLVFRPDLEKLIVDPDLQVASAAGEALLALQATASSGVVRSALQQTGDQKRRVVLATTLVCLGDAAGWRALEEIRSTTLDEHLRAEATLPFLRCASWTDPSRVRPAFEWALNHHAKAGSARRVLSLFLRQFGPSNDMGHAAQERLSRLLIESGQTELSVEVAYDLAAAGRVDAGQTLRALAAQSIPSRWLAARRLAQLRDCDGAESLSRVIQDSRQAMDSRIMATDGLSDCGLEAADIRSLFRPLLQDREQNIQLRLAVASAILRLQAGVDLGQDRGTAPSDEAESVSAAEQVGAEDRGGKPGSLAHIHEDKRPERRRATAEILGFLCSRPALDHVLQFTGDPDPLVRAAALRSVGRRLGPQCPTLAPTVQLALRNQVTKIAREGSVHEQLIANLLLIRLGDTNRNSLVADCASAEDELSRMDCATLADGQSGVLRQLLADPSPSIWFKAALRLAELGRTEGVSRLMETVQQGGALGLRAYAAMLFLQKVVEPPEDLEEQYHSASLPVRYELLLSLGQHLSLPANWLLRFVRMASRDPAVVLRRRAARLSADRYLGTGEAEFLAQLLALAEDRDAAVRIHVAELLRQIRSRPPGATVDASQIKFAEPGRDPMDGGSEVYAKVGASAVVPSTTPVPPKQSPNPVLPYATEIYEALASNDLKRARQLFGQRAQRAKTSVERAAVLYLEARLHEAEQGTQDVAANQYAQYLHIPGTPPTSRSTAEKALARLGPLLGQLSERDKEGGQCRTKTTYFAPGKRDVSLMNGRKEQLQFRPGKVVERGSCD